MLPPSPASYRRSDGGFPEIIHSSNAATTICAGVACSYADREGEAYPAPTIMADV
jgi:hypothetical protein